MKESFEKNYKALITQGTHIRDWFSYKLRYIVGFWLGEIAISTNPKPTIYRNLYENTGPGEHFSKINKSYVRKRWSVM